MKLPFKYFLLLLASYLYLGEHLHAQDNCGRFKNGSFKIVDHEAGTSLIRRYGDRQTEVLEGKRDTAAFVVKWISKCSYILTPTKETFKLYPDLPKTAQLTVVIKETGENYYIQTSSSNFMDGEVTSKVEKTGY